MKDYEKIKEALAAVDKALAALFFTQGYESVKEELENCASELQSEIWALEDMMAEEINSMKEGCSVCGKEYCDTI